MEEQIKIVDAKDVTFGPGLEGSVSPSTAKPVLIAEGLEKAKGAFHELVDTFDSFQPYREHRDALDLLLPAMRMKYTRGNISSQMPMMRTTDP